MANTVEELGIKLIVDDSQVKPTLQKYKKEIAQASADLRKVLDKNLNLKNLNKSAFDSTLKKIKELGAELDKAFKGNGSISESKLNSRLEEIKNFTKQFEGAYRAAYKNVVDEQKKADAKMLSSLKKAAQKRRAEEEKEAKKSKSIQESKQKMYEKLWTEHDKKEKKRLEKKAENERKAEEKSAEKAKAAYEAKQQMYEKLWREAEQKEKKRLERQEKEEIKSAERIAKARESKQRMYENLWDKLDKKEKSRQEKQAKDAEKNKNKQLKEEETIYKKRYDLESKINRIKNDETKKQLTKELDRIETTLKAETDAHKKRLSFVKEYGDLASKINNKLKEEHDDDTTSEHGKNNSFWGAFLNRGSGGWSGGLGRLAGLSIRGAIVGAGWAAAGYMKNRVKGGFDMAGELAQIQAISKATDTEMDRLADTSVRLASSFRVATKDSLALFKSLSRLGVESKNIDTVSKAAVALSTAVGGDLEKAGEVLVTTMNAFNVSYSNADKFASKFVNTLNSSAIDLNKFNTIMSYVAVSGESVGVSFDEAAAMISVLANSGMKASQVGTSLRTIFSELAGRGESLSTVIGRLKDGLMTYADASELVGVRAANSLSILVDKWDEVKTAQSEAFNTIADASSQAYYTIEKNFGNKIATMFKGLTAKMNKFFADMMVVDDEKAVANMMKSDDDDVRAAGFKEGFSRWVKQNNKTIIGQSSQSLENLVDEYIKSQKGKQIVSFSGGSNVSSSTVVTGDIGSEASRYREQLIASAKKQQSEEFFSKTEPIMLEWYNNQIKSGRYDDNLYGDISGNPALRREALKYWSEMASNEGVDLPLASIMGFMDNNFTNFNKINTYRGAVDEVKRIVKKLKETEDGTFTKAGKWESKRSYSGKTYSRAQLEENDRLINTMEKLISEWGIGEEDLNFILNSLGMKPMSKQPLRMNTTFSEINAQLKNALPTEMIEDVVSSVELLREDLNEELSKTSSRSEKERLIMEFADKIKSKLDLISEDSLNLYADSMTDFLDSLKEDTLRAYDVQKSNLDAKYAKSAKTKADKAAYELESNRLINERDRTLGNIDRFSLDTTRAGIKGRRSINSANKGLLSHIGIRISGFDEDSFMDVQKALEDVNSSFYGDIKSTKGYSKKDLANVKDKLKNLGELIDTKFTTSMLKLAEDEALVNKQYEKYDGSIYQKMGMSEDEFNQEKSMYLERIGKGRVAAATAKTNAMKNVEVQTADVMSKENELHNAKVDVWGGVSQDGLSTALDAYKTFNQLALQESLDRINREIEAENNKANKLQGINSSLQKSGLISAEQYAAEKERIDKENLDAVNKLNEKAFEQQKKAQKQEATINYTQKLAEMAINVLVANSKQGVLGIATAPAVIAAYTAIASAQYAVQMAAIGKQKFVPQKYEQGGYVDGASHAQGGIPISVNGDIREMEGGEFIVNKRATAKHLSLLNAINNSGKYADGGYVSPRYSSTISNDQVSISQGDSLNLEMVKLLTELRNNPIKAYVRISDIEQGNELREINRNRFTI